MFDDTLFFRFGDKYINPLSLKSPSDNFMGLYLPNILEFLVPFNFSYNLCSSKNKILYSLSFIVNPCKCLKLSFSKTDGRI